MKTHEQVDLSNQLGDELVNQLWNLPRVQLLDQLDNQLVNQLVNQLYNQLYIQLHNQLRNQLK